MPRQSARATGNPIPQNAAPVSSEVNFAPIVRDDVGRISQQDAASLLGVDPRTLRNWRSQGCGAVSSGGPVHLAGVWQWREARLKEEYEADRRAVVQALGREMTADEVEVERQLTLLRLDQIKLARALDVLIDRDTFIHALSTALADVTSRLRSMSASLAPRLAVENSAAICAQRIDDEVEAIIADLHADRVMAKASDADA